jgi:tRNA 2-thiouridine synthesizing protein A
LPQQWHEVPARLHDFHMKSTEPGQPGIAHDDLWDAGDLGCGELVMHLRNRLRAIPGKVLKLVARDPGAPADIPAYCRMTGHELVREDPASHCYWIRAKP